MKFKVEVFLQILKKFIPKSVKLSLKLFIKTLLESILYSFERKNVNNVKFAHVIFVCQGNVCRSAFAEYYLRSCVSSASIFMESCGLNVHHDGPSPDSAIAVSRKLGVDLKHHTSKSYTACDLDKADLIIPMEYSQYLHLLTLYPSYREKIFLLKSFSAWPHRLACNIYDPYGLGEAEYEDCFRQIQKAIDRLLLNK